jgi:hypothetical protein
MRRPALPYLTLAAYVVVSLFALVSCGDETPTQLSGTVDGPVQEASYSQMYTP